MVFFAQKVAHFVFFYYLCARKIRGVHQLAADVDYFADTRMLRTLHSKKIITFRIKTRIVIRY